MARRFCIETIIFLIVFVNLSLFWY